ncbi:MAG: VWA domain-containing protein, partial [Eubacteriales bacterium]|nr:VWA domain-containing protein [Eubacteriales bacterium]
TGFYYLARSIVVKNETDFDKFDQAFLEFFKDAHYDGDLPEQFMEWVNHPTGDFDEVQKDLRKLNFPADDFDEILKMIEERLKEQKEEHDSGKKWIGTHGYTAFGNAGWHPHGVRIGGKSMYRTARSIAGERRYRDFRKDNSLDTRNFQVAFKTLRNLSSMNDASEMEFDIDGTVKATADHAGTLKIEYKPPRRNTIKLLLLMDSGGSIEYYSGLCSALFKAAVDSRHFKELSVYYFHNCIYDRLYTEPSLAYDTSLPVEQVLANFGNEYRVILVGDAMMDPYELHGHFYDWHLREYSKSTGMERFDQLLRKYPYIVWLNPEKAPVTNGYWNQTHVELMEHFPMFQLSQEGLEQAMKKLMTRS